MIDYKTFNMKSKEVLTIILIIVAGIYFGINKKSRKNTESSHNNW